LFARKIPPRRFVIIISPPPRTRRVCSRSRSYFFTLSAEEVSRISYGTYDRRVCVCVCGTFFSRFDKLNSFSCWHFFCSPFLSSSTAAGRVFKNIHLIRPVVKHVAVQSIVFCCCSPSTCIGTYRYVLGTMFVKMWTIFVKWRSHVTEQTFIIIALHNVHYS